MLIPKKFSELFLLLTLLRHELNLAKFYQNRLSSLEVYVGQNVTRNFYIHICLLKISLKSI